MSSSPDQLGPGPRPEGVPASEIEALAECLIALVEELEETISGGRVPPAFEERLAELQRTAQRLTGS